MTGAWEELRSGGSLGPRAAQLIYETVDVVRRFDRYPPPAGHDFWDAATVQEVAHDFIAEDGAGTRLARIVSTASDEQSFERVLEAAVRNHFRMAARRTDTGAVLRALTHAVDQDDQIIVSGTSPATRTWALAEHAQCDPFTGDPAALIAVAYAVTDVQMARWSASSNRRAPIAERESLRRVLHAILGAAGAPVASRLMLDIVLQRFPLAMGDPPTEIGPSLEGHHTANDSRLLARDVWDQMNDNERLVAGLLDLPVRDIGEATGLSKSTAQRAAASAKALLVEFLGDLDHPGGIIAALVDASAALREHGTSRAGSASVHSEEA